MRRVPLKRERHRHSEPREPRAVSETQRGFNAVSHFSKIRLLATAAPLTLAFAVPAWAQQDPATTSTSPVATANAASQDEATTEVGNSGDIVVTGSILRRTDTETPSPVTIVTAESLDLRGISTIQDGIQQLSSNNGPALTNSFTANGAFAAGASAVSLRGLSTNSTLVLFDGLRAAYYPLADDGSRNFVDLNTIPDDIVDRVEVLRDGASSSYGADAIAGVVNIITKKEFKGVGGRAEAGISQKGDAATQRLTLTAGYGDLEDQGFNAYVSGFYYRSEALMNRDRKYPYNTDDQRGVCAPGVSIGDTTGACGPNLTVAGRNNAGVFAPNTTITASNFLIRPADAANANTIPDTRYVSLGNSCPGTLLTLSAAELATNPTAPAQICNLDYTNLFGTITPNIERFGASARLTARIGDTIEAYGMINFIQSRSSYFSAAPATIRGIAPTGIFYPQFATDRVAGATTTADSGILALPVYVCPRNGRSAISVNGVPTFVGGCTATTTGAVLNPNNPFAAAGQVGRLAGRDVTQTPYNETRNRAYRAAFGVSGNITDAITFDVGATAMHNDLRRTQDGYVYIQRLLDVVADGSYNFRNPSANSQATLDYLTPESRNESTSDQYQLQATVGFTPFTLPGGPLQIGVGASIRYEAVDAPSGNTDEFGPTQRYFTLNAFGTTGSRRIYSGFAELSAPIVDQFEIDASGRYDKYSSGQDSFSPKIGAKFKPIRQVLIRGTYSKGFRIPSFGEANALPTTGYVTNGVSLFTDSFLAQYGCSTANFASCPTYIRGSYGLTTLASPNLQPEKSRSFTGGILIEPIRGVSFTVDYYNIKKTAGITSPDTGAAVQAYYAGTAIDPSITILPDAPDPNFPNAKPRVGFAQAQLINADTVKAQGLDFTATVNHDFGMFKLASAVDASYILRLSTNDQRYDGTLGNFNLTAGSGTPKWHGTWQNTLDFGSFILTGTANYFDKYNLSATDQGDEYKDCGENPGYSPVGCNVDSYVTFDLNASIKINDQFTFYGTVLNLLNEYPPIDVVTYGANLYNPVQGGLGILGRYFKAGVKVGF